jgi:membrane protein CcdC involved in cytochrome C biogenesis
MPWDLLGKLLVGIAFSVILQLLTTTRDINKKEIENPLSKFFTATTLILALIFMATIFISTCNCGETKIKDPYNF